MKSKTDPIQKLLEKQKECLIFIIKRVKDRSVAEDILQEVNYKIVKSIDQYEEQNKFWPYLMTITENTIISYLRKQDRQQEIFKNESEYEVYAHNLLTENNCLMNMTMDEVMKIIDLLGSDIVTVFCLVYEGYSRKEIAEMTGKSIEEVHAIIGKCRKKLREWREKNY